MTEYRFEGMEHVSTREFHEHRERAPHWEQGAHRPRMEFALELIDTLPVGMVVDLGCGDGGLLAQLPHRDPPRLGWGYDFAPANKAGWMERGVGAYELNWWEKRAYVVLAPVVVLTEVLEHVEDPRGVLAWLRRSSTVRAVVASSPAFETPESHDACHRWGWDFEGYDDLFRAAGWRIDRHATVDWSQVLLAGRA